MDPARLNPAQRAHDKKRATQETFDVVVIGGGVVGAGVALDAATRGLSDATPVSFSTIDARITASSGVFRGMEVARRAQRSSTRRDISSRIRLTISARRAP